VRLLAAAGSFTLLFALLARGLLTEHLTQLATSLPNPLARTLQRLLLLPTAPRLS
jgi:hypothetical protein